MKHENNGRQKFRTMIFGRIASPTASLEARGLTTGLMLLHLPIEQIHQYRKK